MPIFVLCLKDFPGIFPRILGHEAIGLVLHSFLSIYYCVFLWCEMSFGVSRDGDVSCDLLIFPMLKFLILLFIYKYFGWLQLTTSWGQGFEFGNPNKGEQVIQLIYNRKSARQEYFFFFLFTFLCFPLWFTNYNFIIYLFYFSYKITKL